VNSRCSKASNLVGLEPQNIWEVCIKLPLTGNLISIRKKHGNKLLMGHAWRATRLITKIVAPMGLSVFDALCPDCFCDEKKVYGGT
jgi:hypothetical protein